ncbi:MAG: 23S rRNA (adenine(2503)-C(2))-methyltransferase RlmN [Sedimentisphaerales bacterium]|nr:23S rRNA (adenine(2503)-C(2))-methyltransferase RlmN [Sedimentisphaerales bacterium]
MKRHLLDFTLETLRQALAELHQPTYRADQVMDWVYQHRVFDWSAMSNLPQSLRLVLAENYALRQGQIELLQKAPDGTIKFLLRFPDGVACETVLIPDDPRQTVCISSQVGCPVQCSFCASGQGGLQRSLTAGEIVEQVLWAADQLDESGRISNIVVMGMGEPMLNYDEVMHGLRTLNAEWGLNIGARHITISTVGLPDGILRLAAESLQVTLAVSLHAADDNLRSRLIPIASRYKLDELFAAINAYYDQTHREVTLEYILLAGVNDGLAHADLLARRVRSSRCNVNLINYNNVADTDFRAADTEAVARFAQRLSEQGVNVHVRRSRGAVIDAACGQLRQRQLDNKEPADTSQSWRDNGLSP